MLRKLSAFVLLSVAAGTNVSAQQSPVAPVERRAQTMVLTAPFERSYLGVKMEEISRENYTKFGLSAVRGVGIGKVVENSPAAQAGLQANDVIVRFEDEEVTSVAKLSRLIAEVAPDHTVKITVLRGGGEREFNVILGKRELTAFGNGNFRFETMPTMPAIPITPTMPQMPRGAQVMTLPRFGAATGDGNIFIWRGDASRQIGVGVVPLTKQLGDFFGVAEGRGLLIESVRENSPAAKAGIKAGDIIVEADGKQTGGMIDLIRALNEKKNGDVSLTIIRDRNRQAVRVTPESIKDDAVKPEGFQNLFESN